jgi:uncharacterized protein YggE
MPPAALVALLAVLLLAPAAAAQGAPPATVTVTAEATATGKPDVTNMDLSVVSEGKTAQAAAADNTRKMERLLAVLKKEVQPGGEVKTADYAVEPRYGPSTTQGPTLVVGYTVSNTLRVKLAGTAAAGKIIDLALKEGGNELRQVTFSIADPEPLHVQAVHAAVAKARRDADAIAGALGLRVTGVLSATEGQQGGRPIPFAQIAATKAAAAVPFEPGAVDVAAAVTVVFSTAPGR